MGLFTKQQQDPGRLHYILKLAFERVRCDMHYIFSWVNYFHQKHQEHDARLLKIEQNLAHNSINREEIGQMIDFHLPYSQILKRIEEINQRLDKLESKQPERKIALKERLLRKITKNSKEYIKSVIVGTIKKYGRISGPQLKEIVVDEQGICSKRSFYRLLAEIEQEQEIAAFSDGKEKNYFFKTQVLK